MPFIEINGKKLEAELGAMIIEVADNFNIQIPRFCYHKKLSIAANCRMCLVEVEKSPKPLPACATPITEGMKIWTRSPKALTAQKSTMEFLLINHPLDCPICDQGGECELQDIAMGYGQDHSRYTEAKRVVKDKNLGPLISTDMTRCIHCTRCVRFGSEVAGVRELGALGRGEHLEIGTYIERSVHSEVSGNVIDLCPVGALTSKPFRFRARGWELKQTASIAPHDGLGSNIFIHARNNQVMRVVPKENENINEVWISDRDRFSYEGLYSEERLQHPKIKQGKEWYTVSWQEALNHIAKVWSLTEKNPNDSLGALISPNATLEECYLFQKLVRALGFHNIDHRLRQSDFRGQNESPLFPKLEIPIVEIEQQSATLLIGCDIHKEQPIIGLKLRKMTLNGGKALAINPLDVDFNFEIAAKTIVAQGDLVGGVARLIKAVIQEKGALNDSVALSALKAVSPLEEDVKLATHLIQGEKKLILVGAFTISHPHYSYIYQLISLLAELTGAKIGILPTSANHAGAWLAGCVPHRLPGGRAASVTGLNTSEMGKAKLQKYLLFNVEPDFDCDQGVEIVQALRQASSVVAITSFESQTLQEVAEVLLPLAAFSEAPGTFINIEGQWQSFNAAVPPLGESQPGWKILCEMAKCYQLEGFEYENAMKVLAQIKDEMNVEYKISKEKNRVEDLPVLSRSDQIIRIAPIPLYATDGLVRRAKSLQKTQDAGKPLVYLNAALAKHLHLLQHKHVRVTVNDANIILPFVIDERIPDKTVMMSGGILETIKLGAPYTVVNLEGV